MPEYRTTLMVLCTLPKKFEVVAQTFLQENQMMDNNTLDKLKKKVILEWEQLSKLKALANWISTVKPKGQNPTYANQKGSSHQLFHQKQQSQLSTSSALPSANTGNQQQQPFKKKKHEGKKVKAHITAAQLAAVAYSSITPDNSTMDIDAPMLPIPQNPPPPQQAIHSTLEISKGSKVFKLPLVPTNRVFHLLDLMMAMGGRHVKGTGTQRAQRVQVLTSTGQRTNRHNGRVMSEWKRWVANSGWQTGGRQQRGARDGWAVGGQERWVASSGQQTGTQWVGSKQVRAMGGWQMGGQERWVAMGGLNGPMGSRQQTGTRDGWVRWASGEQWAQWAVGGWWREVGVMGGRRWVVGKCNGGWGMGGQWAAANGQWAMGRRGGWLNRGGSRKWEGRKKKRGAVT
ncbi:hypothetical protein FA15DRAFT_662081 [Coprinopsis marcescibilis]|uniref:Uncharacterized protein n=1 Tax=Coprinopsis marcescibilis TaxID=230819 RepID=A0A5C3K8Z6_COPMA|nr:hypothetical protein FA15DRAFT_662081 [Coprinopsis marcescibilis]